MCENLLTSYKKITDITNHTVRSFENSHTRQKWRFAWHHATERGRQAGRFLRQICFPRHQQLPPTENCVTRSSDSVPGVGIEKWNPLASFSLSLTSRLPHEEPVYLPSSGGAWVAKAGCWCRHTLQWPGWGGWCWPRVSAQRFLHFLFMSLRYTMDKYMFTIYVYIHAINNLKCSLTTLFM